MAARPFEPPVQHSLRPRLAAIAPSAAEVVQFAGGWLFDQVMAGWDVTVITADRADPLPLRILGVRSRDLNILLAAPLAGPCLHAIGLRTDLYDADERVRRMVRTIVAVGRAEIRLWGDCWPADLGQRSAPVSHHLSVAAMAFKAQALAAAAAPAVSALDTELFQRAAISHSNLAAAR
ncbi:MAG: hypothetical protein ACRDOI_33360 [Trebonia sp.]